MSHPFVALGAITITAMTAAFGIIQVPGWIDEAHDSAVSADLAFVQTLEERALLKTRSYWNGNQLQEKAGTVRGRDLPAERPLCVSAAALGIGYAAVGKSDSGTYLARTSASDVEGTGSTPLAAIAAAGGLPPGVPTPVSGDSCTAGAQLVYTPVG
ncbi:hypothetical protein [Microbacterium sp.]|uniref:hypothetical protein n=1 Tax=Microbacterium sp. TaxID=51671 RepID=UPI002BBD85F1|nr:hypothetical protein [Microbacterium sp.]HWL78030.1 hypothetical protein [Microbacterium sp.]